LRRLQRAAQPISFDRALLGAHAAKPAQALTQCQSNRIGSPLKPAENATFLLNAEKHTPMMQQY
jgi:hypothetical protein